MDKNSTNKNAPNKAKNAFSTTIRQGNEVEPISISKAIKESSLIIRKDVVYKWRKGKIMERTFFGISFATIVMTFVFRPELYIVVLYGFVSVISILFAIYFNIAKHNQKMDE